MTEIKKFFKSEDYELNIHIQNRKVEIGLSGKDRLTQQDVLEFYTYNDTKELLLFLRTCYKSLFLGSRLTLNDLI